ncbi:carbohydrate ABC transporter permease [Cohnella rhizosphaerae]|uniref:Carbohydrate ABC transporter permease n=1 Tax=Cohnella rhizosphaerae TaxID=1457232 RepID=A0A9X4QW56_9BACL|nr:carbohydrate ABC transporter permease [Cohnella rhizosphaerae]MDG0813299.1 carbohydrate ABC transporter permease [Cohnella rhizosphaerae]
MSTLQASAGAAPEVAVPRSRALDSRPVYRWLINTLFILVSACIFVPFLLVVVSSFSSEDSILSHGYRFIPERWSLGAYRLVFQSPKILLRAYGVTTFVTVVGTAAGLLLTAMTGWVLSRSDYRFNRQATFYVFFTMLFGGGLVPFYILMTQYLHLKDSLLAVIIPGLLSPFHIMVMKGFLSKIPFEMIESAKVDGSSEMRIFFTMVLPLSTPALTTLGLTIAFNYWNEWFNAMLFIDKPNLATLQLAARPDAQHDRIFDRQHRVRQAARHRRRAAAEVQRTDGDGHPGRGADALHLSVFPALLRLRPDARLAQRLTFRNGNPRGGTGPKNACSRRRRPT